jgi:hypothetical protein
MPPQRAFEGTEADRINRLRRIGGVEQPNFDWSQAISRRDGEGRRKRHRVADDFVAPSISRVRSAGIGARKKNFRVRRRRREQNQQGEKGRSSHGLTTGGRSGCHDPKGSSEPHRATLPVRGSAALILGCARSRSLIARDSLVALQLRRSRTASDGSLVRYLNEQDSTGSSYKRCML